MRFGLSRLALLPIRGIGKAAERFAVTGIRKIAPVGDADDASLVLIAKELPLPCDGLPEKGKQGFAAGLGGRPVELPLEGTGPISRLPASTQQVLGPAKDLLPPQPSFITKMTFSRFERLRGGQRRPESQATDRPASRQHVDRQRADSHDLASWAILAGRGGRARSIRPISN